MKQRSWFRSLLFVLVAAGLLAPAWAEAQTSVVVLGIRSIEGDDEFARNLTGALRHAASQVQGWNVSDREVTLTQMALAHGCEEPDPTCLGQMAETLRTQRIIFGDVRRTSAGSTYDWSLNLHVFNGETGRIDQSVPGTIPGVRRDIDDLREPVRRYVAALSGAPRVGTLHISVNVPGAEVFIDDEAVGVADARGRLEVPSVQAGSRNIRIAAPGHQGFRSTVAVEAYGGATFEAELQAGGGGGGGGGGQTPVELIAGVGLLVVAAGLAAGWIGSWASLRGLNDDPTFIEYRRQAGDFVRATQGPGVDVSGFNACMFAADNPRLVDETPDPDRQYSDLDTAGRALSICNEANTLEVLQFVMGIGAAAAAGVGLYFLVTALTGDTAPAQQSWRLVPSAGPEHAYLGVHVSF